MRAWFANHQGASWRELNARAPTPPDAAAHVSTTHPLLELPRPSNSWCASLAAYMWLSNKLQLFQNVGEKANWLSNALLDQPRNLYEAEVAQRDYHLLARYITIENTLNYPVSIK